MHRPKRLSMREALILGLLAITPPVVHGQPLLGIHPDTGKLYGVSTADASLSLIGNTGLFGTAALAFAPDGTLYGFTVGQGSMLVRIDPATAVATPIASLTAVSLFEGGLAISPNGVAYGATSAPGSTPFLFTMNLVTGSVTHIGPLPSPSDINGLAWRSDGMLVALDRTSNSLLTINPATAAASPLAVVTATVGAVGDMTVLNGRGYFATGGPGPPIPGSNELWSFDMFTGQQTLVGSFAPTITGVGISGLAARAVPEPGTLSLLGFGTACLVGFCLRKAKNLAPYLTAPCSTGCQPFPGGATSNGG